MLVEKVGIDLGTANTLFATRSRGLILNEASVIAIENRTDARKIFSVGSEAKLMIGKAPTSIEVYTPLREGVIANFEVAEMMIEAFFNKVFPSRKLFKPDVVVCVPYGATPVEKKAIQQSLLRAGSKRVGLIDEPMAAALGIGLPVFEPTGSMVVDIGGGTTEIAIISLGGIVEASSLRIGGNHFDKMIIDTVRKLFNLNVGYITAERIKHTVLDALFEGGGESGFEIAGLGAYTGLPSRVLTSSVDYKAPTVALIDKIEDEIRNVLEKAPPDLASDIHANGIALAGGGAMLKNLDLEMTRRLQIKVSLVEEPKYSVVYGTALAASFEKKFSHAIIYDV
jgi:rod shape-determining protein MreB and related proteins